jgi:GAF domain-containing protein
MTDEPSQGRVLGIINVEHHHVNAFPQAARGAVKILASTAAVALQNALLSAALEEFNAIAFKGVAK